MSKALVCPYCDRTIRLKFFDYANLRPGFLLCPECRQRIQFPLGTRLLAVAAGLLLSGFVMAVAMYGESWNSSAWGDMALKVLAFVAGVAVLMATMAFVCRGLATRLEKVGRD